MSSGEANRSGFTLIEVLVVVAIIALLISILLPSLSVARDQAKTSAGASNLRQIGLALNYAFEEYKAYPLFDDGTEAAIHGNVLATWVDVLFVKRYLGNLNAGYCPKDTGPDPLNKSRGAQWGWNYPTARGGGPGVDFSYGISAPMSTMGWRVPESDFNIEKFTSNIVLAADSWWIWMHGFSAEGLDARVNDALYPWWGANTVGYRHGSRQRPAANVAFLDSSVRLVKLNLNDRYASGVPDQPGPIRGLRTSNKYFWRPAEHTGIGYGSSYNGLNIDANPYPNGDDVYPLGHESDCPKELDPAFYTKHKKWPKTVLANKGWTE